MKLHYTGLSDFERAEIVDYSEIWYIGERSRKKAATRDEHANNYGYDDDRGDYHLIEHDHLAYRYEVIGLLGKGSFGQVLQCRDHATGRSVAIKIIRNKKRFHHQALVEVKILENLKKWVRFSIRFPSLFVLCSNPVKRLTFLALNPGLRPQPLPSCLIRTPTRSTTSSG
jgi:hypothetical protein